MSKNQGWKIVYHHPSGNYSGVCFANTHEVLTKEKEWMDEGGFSYIVTEVPENTAIPRNRSWAN